MTHRGPFQPLLFCDSVIIKSNRQHRAKRSCKFTREKRLKSVRFSLVGTRTKSRHRTAPQGRATSDFCGE